MIVSVHWETTYRYSAPVRRLHTELRVVPANREGGQRLLSTSLLLDPPANPRVLTDVFGNTLHHVDFLEPVDLLHVVVGAQDVVTAVGRDYDDVPPLRGAYTGVAEEVWSTSVRVAADAQ